MELKFYTFIAQFWNNQILRNFSVHSLTLKTRKPGFPGMILLGPYILLLRFLRLEA